MRKRLCAMIMALLLLCCLQVSASAETLIDLDIKGSISVKAVYQKSPLEGMKLNCIQVGKIVFDVEGYYYESLYHDAIYTADNIHDSKYPEEMLKHVKKSSCIGLTQSVNKNGYVKFENLTPGLYLVYQTDVFSMYGNKYKIHPFFVTLPYDGSYHVDATCKPGLDLFPEKPVCPPGTPGKPIKITRLPQTGQLSWPVPVLACGGMAFFALGWWLSFGSRKDPHEK